MRISDWSSDVCSSDLINRHSVGFLAPSYVDGNIIVGADSSTNPFGRDLTVYRTFIEQGAGTGRRNEVESNLYRIVAGLEGNIGAWSWDVSANLQHLNQFTNSGRDIVRQRLQKAVDAPDDLYPLRCEDTPGCIQIDLFGPAGSIPQAQPDSENGRATCRE